jgi:translation initiation factor IF-2
MDSPRGRPGRTPVSVKPIAAALAVALMGMGGVALAAPKADSTAPEQGNGPAPQANTPAPQAQDGPAPPAQANGPAPQAQNPAPPPQAKAKGHQSAGKPAEVPPPAPTQGGGNPAPGSDQAGPRYHGRPAAGEVRGQRRGSSRGNCQSAACRGAVPTPDAEASGEQPLPVGGQQDPPGGPAPGGSEGPPHRDRAGGDSGDHQLGAPETETGSVLGANQGGGEQVEADTRSFDTALPFTGFEVVLLAGIGALLWLVGLRLRRSTA